VGITAGSREVPGRKACDKRHPYRMMMMMMMIMMMMMMIMIIIIN